MFFCSSLLLSLLVLLFLFMHRFNGSMQTTKQTDNQLGSCCQPIFMLRLCFCLSDLRLLKVLLLLRQETQWLFWLPPAVYLLLGQLRLRLPATAVATIPSFAMDSNCSVAGIKSAAGAIEAILVTEVVLVAVVRNASFLVLSSNDFD